MYCLCLVLYAFLVLQGLNKFLPLPLLETISRDESEETVLDEIMLLKPKYGENIRIVTYI